MSEPRRRHFASLEGARAVAAIAVVVYHFSASQTWSRNSEVVARTVGRLGNLGVCVFFLLSGFVLYRPRTAATISHTPQEPLRRYIPFRLLRILPAYWLALGFLLFAFWYRNPYDLPVGDATSLSHHIRFFGLLQTYDPTYVIRGLGVAWTLSIEVAFYLTLPLIGWAVGQLSKEASEVDAFKRRQLIGLLIFSLVGFGSRFILLSNPSTKAEGVSWPISYLDWFGLGMMLAVISVCQDKGARSGWFVRRVLSRTGLSFSIAAVLFAVVTVVLPPQGHRPFDAFEIHVRFLGNSAIALFLLAPLVLGSPTVAHRSLETAPMQFLGKVSYGLYLWHMIWIAAVFAWADQGLIADWWGGKALLVMVLTLASATVSFVIAEQPMMDWKARVRARDRAIAPVPSTKKHDAATA